MAIASLIITPQKEKLAQVQEELAAIDNLTVEAVSDKGEIVAVAEAASLKEMKQFLFDLEKLDNILGIYPVYSTDKDEA